MVRGPDQSVDHVADDGQVLAELAFRPPGQFSGLTEIFACIPGLNKKGRFIDHVFTHLAVGSLVMLEKIEQLPGGKSMLHQSDGQPPSMIGVGARHRG